MPDLQTSLAPSVGDDPNDGVDVARTLTFVCCVEAGGLEEQTVRMVESLRRWGGRFAACPVIAVTPRLGVPLTRRSIEAFERLGVRHLQRRTNKRHAWFKYLNKPHALLAAGEVLETEQACWVDSDILFVREPSTLVLKPSEDFAACASDRNIGTNGHDEFAPYWNELVRLFGLELGDLPLVTAIEENVPIHFYFNSGVFAYRAATDFARHYLDGCVRVLESKIASRHSDIFFTDQVALGLVAISKGLRWRAFDFANNYPLTSKAAALYDPAKLRSCAICHYHDYLWEPHYSVFIERLEAERPEIAAWVRGAGALQNRLPAPWKMINFALRFWRDKKTARWTRGCRVL